MRKHLIRLLAILLAVLPLLGVWANTGSAATSRVAVVKELKGSVKVKKAGGSKEFTAFAKMSLNEGDVLSVGSGSSAVLQFANGTSEDDKMTVASNSTLTFSKLSSKQGTTTKVSLFNGSAWVDVKSIENKDDEFSLETPTSIMGVRGTHLYVSVDPVTGATRLMVAAGVVTAQTTDSSNPQTENVYPTERALAIHDLLNGSLISIAQVDLELLIKQSDKSIIEAILKASGEIMKENIDKNGLYPDLSEHFENNLNNLIGAIVAAALEANKIDTKRVNEIIAEVMANTGMKIDLSKKALELTDEEKAKQENQKKLEREALEKALDQKKREEQLRDQQAELQKKLQEQREKQQKEKEKALEESRKKALEEYERQLSEKEKQIFEEENNKRNKELQDQLASPSATNSGSGGGGSSGSGGTGGNGTVPPTDSSLGVKYYYYDANSNLKWNKAAIDFKPEQLNYEFKVPGNTLKAAIANRLAVNIKVESVKVFSGIEFYDTVNLVDEEYLIPLDLNTTKIEIKVLINETITKYFTVMLTKDPTPVGLTSLTQSYKEDSDWYSFDWMINSGNTYGYSVSSSGTQLKLDWTFASGVGKAVVKHTKYALDGRNGQIIPIEDATTMDILNDREAVLLDISNDVDVFEVQLKNASGASIGPGFTMWVIDYDLDIYSDKPFLINGDTVSYERENSEPNFYANVNESVSSLQITQAEGLIYTPYKAINYRSGTVINATNGKITIPLQEGNNELRIVLKNTAGGTMDYELTVSRLNLPQGIRAWSVTDSDDRNYHWELAANQPSGAIKRYYIMVDDVSFVKMKFTVAEGQSLTLTNSSGAFPIMDMQTFDLGGKGGYTYTVMNGSVPIAELLIIKVGLPTLNEDNLSFTQGGSTILQTIPTFDSNQLPNGFAVVSDTSSTEPITMKLEAYLGDIAVFPVETGVTLNSPYFTMNFPAPGIYHVNIRAHDPTNYEQYVIYPVTIYYGVSP
ncbi:FecR family protein [Cohnella mopanensis]|uniref:FecR family protein n=1 Tax=Cohnella mopanensis TaxID=2911966 RepID=UPI001EF7B8E5|nr:FecR family protein [Cohnella mopanensis]